MRYTKEEIFNQARNSPISSNLDGRGYEAMLSYGTKISRDLETGEIEFFNCTKGGSYYAKFTDEEIEVFLEKGWRRGVYVLYLSNNRFKLSAIEKATRKAVNERCSVSVLKSLSARRDRILSRYNKINLKLKSIQNGAD
jgi:hypothetical protein